MVSMANCYTARFAEIPPDLRPLSIATDWLSSAMRFCARPCSRLTQPTPMKLILCRCSPCFSWFFVKPTPSEKNREMGLWHSQRNDKTCSKPFQTSLSPLKKIFFYPCDIISKVSADLTSTVDLRLSKRMRFASVTAAVLAKRSTCGELFGESSSKWIMV